MRKLLRNLSMSVIGAIGVGGLALSYLGQKSLKRETEIKERYRQRYELVNRWLLNKSWNLSMEEYLRRENINDIAIYGMGTLGEMFFNEIAETGVVVSYIIDKNVKYNEERGIPLISIEEISVQKNVDAIIITPVYYYDEIVDDLKNAGVQTRLVSLREIIFGMY